MAHSKSNVDRLAVSLRYRIEAAEPGVTRFKWLVDDPCLLTADDLVSWKPDEDRRGPERRNCVEFVRELLAERGSTRASEIKAEAKKRGLEFKRSTWDRSKEYLGVRSQGRGQEAVWKLPSLTDN